MTTDEQRHRLERLQETSRALSASLGLEPFLNTLLQAASELTGCEAASILEAKPGEDDLRFLASTWFQREKLRQVKVPIRLSLAGWVFENAQSTMVADVKTEKRHYREIDQITGIKTRSLMAVPIIFQGETLGVLEVVNKTGDAHYTEDDQTILETLASQAAISIQNTRLMDKVRKALEEASQLDRMKADFIAIASHELRTPVGLVIGHATYLRETVGPEYHDQLDVIVRSSMRLKEIIDNLSNIDDIERGLVTVRRRHISITRIAREVVASYQEEAKSKNLSLTTELGQEELMAEGDAAKIDIALNNLVKNAITFTDPGGHILVTAEKITGHIKVSVIDDGIGIPARDLARIFERFYQVERHLTRKHGGMGLGLSAAKIMIELHGGRIWAESTEGKGSSFTFLLPITRSGRRGQPGDQTLKP
jgi:signal transduction histidine kinase